MEKVKIIIKLSFCLIFYLQTSTKQNIEDNLNTDNIDKTKDPLKRNCIKLTEESFYLHEVSLLKVQTIVILLKLPIKWKTQKEIFIQNILKLFFSLLTYR